MNETISFELSTTRDVGVQLDLAVGESVASVGTLRSVLADCGACWGGDQYGAEFGRRYLPAANDAMIGAIEIEGVGQLNRAAGRFLSTDVDQEQIQTESVAVGATRAMR